MAIKVAFFDTKPYDKKSFEEMNIGYGFDITYFEMKLTSKVVDIVVGFDAVCAFVNDAIDSDVIDHLYANGVKLITMRCAGYNNVDFKAAYKKVYVTRVPAYSPYAVAEHAMALVTTLNRKTHKAYTRTRDANFAINGLLGFDLHGKTAGVVGGGQIGRCLIDILLGYGMEVLLYDPFPNETYAKEKGITYVSMNELYEKSDVISLHCPLTEETTHMINDGAIEKMKEGVIIINTGRGKLINTDALINGLKSGKVGAAGLDVYEEEGDYFFEDKSNEPISDDTLARLLTFPNVLVTSHQAFFTKEALYNIAETTLNNVRDCFAGEYLDNEVCYQCENDCVKENKKRCF